MKKNTSPAPKRNNPKQIAATLHPQAKTLVRGGRMNKDYLNRWRIHLRSNRLLNWELNALMGDMSIEEAKVVRHAVHLLALERGLIAPDEIINPSPVEDFVLL